MTRSRRRQLQVYVTLGTLAVLAIGALFLWQRPQRSLHGAPAAKSVAAAHDAVEKTLPEATYVGMAACTQCHAEQARTYAQTAHSLALADVEPASEPSDATFYQEASGRTYTVYRDAGQFRHREAVISDTGEEIAASDYPVRYLIGSGRHTRSYLVDIDGFLCESPLTWYASRKNWGVSPGYDGPNPPGFERAAETTCLFCHVGRLADNSHVYQRVEIVEQAIGCERCHGPGSLHVAKKREGGDKSADERPTIVNPARLSRQLSEAVCAQCHLNTDAMALARGRELADFRPGLPLAEFCINYHPSESESQTSQMTVVGHVEQMRLSRCYQESETLTCTTCHDPHSESAQSTGMQKQAHFIQVCVDCHAERGCRLDLDERLRHPSANNCLTCHMPQVDTEIRHIAFTHHRIGIHEEHRAKNQAVPTAGRPPAGIPNLVPLDQPPSISETDRERNLGLAYFSLSQKQADRMLAAAFRERAQRLFENVRARGGGHREVAAALVRLYRDVDADAALRLAHEALSSGGLAMKSEINCLFFFGEFGVQRGQPLLAIAALEQLTKIRLLSEDWRLLGISRQQVADYEGARLALERAVELAPLRPQVHRALAEIYQRLGRGEESRREADIAAGLVRQAARKPSSH